MTTDTPTLTLWNPRTKKWDVLISPKEQARRAAAKAADKAFWAKMIPVILDGTLTA